MAKENLGIVVQYKVKIRLSIGGALGGELVAELPFTLTHPKPVESPQVANKQVFVVKWLCKWRGLHLWRHCSGGCRK